jgi:hypothetical protein
MIKRTKISYLNYYYKKLISILKFICKMKFEKYKLLNFGN